MFQCPSSEECTNDLPMMTSSNGNIFRVTGHLCGEFTGPRWIPRTKASDAELWCKRLSKQRWGWWFETLSCQLWRHCNAYTQWSPSNKRRWPEHMCTWYHQSWYANTPPIKKAAEQYYGNQPLLAISLPYATPRMGTWSSYVGCCFGP